jgi:hypothetical protein
VRYSLYFECCGIESRAMVDAPTKEDAVRQWESENVSEDIKTNFGLFFLQPTYAEMRLAAHGKDAELIVTEAV